jgi:5-formyltetrahydrofolate cyclo-ligase
MTDIIAKEKAELREFMAAKRKIINHKSKRDYDKEICHELKKIALIKNPKVVHSYLPIKGEIDVTPFLKWLLEKRIKVVCPKVLPKRQLESIELLHFDDFDMGPFNTIHPSGNVVYSGSIDMVVLPGLAFDKKLNRLGYGGGYYDRFLAKNIETIKAAVLYPFQLVDKIPTEEHDIKMDRLIVSQLPFIS